MIQDPSLLALVAAAHARALKRVAQLPLHVEDVEVQDSELPFRATWISSLALKDQAGNAESEAPGATTNPFLPYEQDLYVADLSPTHVLLLNKFPLESGHVLAVTREFQPQQGMLSAGDFAAISPLLAEADGLLMYNGGRVAGASQEHRHLHFLPTQLAPLEGLFSNVYRTPGIHEVAQFRFPHKLVRFDAESFEDPAAANRLHALFLDAASKCGLGAGVDGTAAPYNILMTRRWMLVVPRSREHFEAEGVKVSVNAFNYGGIVVVREPEHLDVVRHAGLHAILSACAGRHPA